MEELNVILNQVVLFVLLMGLGFLLARLGILNSSGLESLSRLIAKTLLPVLIFYNSVISTDRDSLSRFFMILPAALFSFAFLYICSYVMQRALRLPPSQAGIYRFMQIFGNVGFIGIPVITALYPQVGMACISVYTVVDQPLMWTLGASLVRRKDESQNWIARIRRLISPSLISVFLATSWITLRLPLPTVFSTAMQTLSGSTMPLSLLYIGGSLFFYDRGGIFRKKSLYALCLLRMLILPLCVFLILRVFKLSEDFSEIIAILAGIPAPSVAPILAQEHGADTEYAGSGVMLTTLSCIVTLPVLILLLQILEKI